MKKFIVSVAAVLISATALSATANATPITEYLNDLTDAGMQVSESNQEKWLTLGMAVCVDLMNGTPVRKEYSEILAAGFTSNQAQVLITASVVDLCPSAASRGNVVA